MKVCAITMQFPVQSETFAIRDFISWSENGIDLSILTLKQPKNKKIDKELRANITNLNINPSLGISLANISIFFKVALKLLPLTIKSLYREHSLIEAISIFYFFPRYIKILTWIEITNPNVLHLYWGHYPSLIGIYVKKYYPKIVVSIFLGAYDLYKNLIISRKCVDLCDCAWTHSKANFKILESNNFSSSKFQLNYRSIDFKKIKIQTNYQYSKPVDFLSVCRLVPNKGIKETLKAMAFMAREGLDFKYSVVGFGPELDSLKRDVKKLSLSNHVEFLGYQNTESVFNLMSNANTFIQLSDKEGECLPNSLKEALWHRCYCIVAYSPGINELIIDEDFGKVIDKYNTNEVYNELKKFNKKIPLLKYPKIEDYLLKNFDINNSTKKYLEIWKNKVKLND